MDQHIVDNLNIKSIHFVGLSDSTRPISILGPQNDTTPWELLLGKTGRKELSRTLEKEGRHHGNEP